MIEVGDTNLGHVGSSEDTSSSKSGKKRKKIIEDDDDGNESSEVKTLKSKILTSKKRIVELEKELAMSNERERKL